MSYQLEKQWAFTNEAPISITSNKYNHEIYTWGRETSVYEVINNIIMNENIEEEKMSRKIYLYEVVFNNSLYYKRYNYWSYEKLDLNRNYDIIADYQTKYDNSIYVVSISENVNKQAIRGFRQITSARCLDVVKRTDGNVKNIYLNEEKGTTVVVWNDGSKTKVKCQDGEEFDAEKGIALCFMKKACDNRACFNEILKKYCN